MRKQILGMMLCACVCASCDKNAGGVFEPVEPPVEKLETPTTPPSTEDLLTIKIENEIMAVVGTGRWNGIAYGNGTYVAVADDGYVATSTDGVNWTISDRVLCKHLSSICYGNGLFLTVSYAAFRAVSVDGVTWTNKATSSSYSDNGYQCITYGNGMFVFGNYYGKLFMTTDGTKVYKYQAPRIENFTGIAYGNGEFIAVSKSGYQYYYNSSDGISWAQNEYDANNTTRPVRLAFGKDKFVAINVNQKLFINSVDGRTWSTGIQVSTKTGAEILWDNIVYDNGYFIAYGHIYAGSSHSTSYITASVDGISWRDPIQLVDEQGGPIESADGILGRIIVMQ